jgi:hypothetical protein
MEIVSPSLQRGNLSPSLEHSYNTPLINLPTTCLAEPRCSNGMLYLPLHRPSATGNSRRGGDRNRRSDPAKVRACGGDSAGHGRRFNS